MQPDIQEDAIAPSAGRPAVAPSAARCSLRSAGVYAESCVFWTAEISNLNLLRGWRGCRPRDTLHKHMLLSYKAPTQASPAANTASAGQQVSCEKLLAAREQLKTWLLLISVMDEAAMLVLALTEAQLNLLGSR